MSFELFASGRRISFRSLAFEMILLLLVCVMCLQWPKQLNAPLEVVDPEIADIIELEKARQWKVSLGSLFFS